MELYHGIERFQPPAAGVVLTVGNFDGVHLGHRRLIETARRKARDLDAPVVAVTFEPHPVAVVSPRRVPARLTTLREKAALLEAMGVAAMIVLRSDRELLGQTAEEFLVDLVVRCRPRVIVEGPTFNFGRGRQGTVRTLREHATRLGFALSVVDELHSDGLADRPAINSSAIRAALLDGRLAHANAMLGRPYRIVGAVGGGEERGVALGFPTANLNEIPHLLPREAVYVAVAQLADDRLHLSAVNIGPQPTFAQAERRVEAHLLDYRGELRGQRLGLHLLAKLRGQVKFDGAEALAAQLRRDVDQARSHQAQLARMRSEPIVPL